MATVQDQIAQYVALLAFQYRTKSRASQTIAIYVKQVVASLLAFQLQDAFNVDTAVGAQLDILGKYIGLPRNVGDPIDRPYYSFSDYDGTVRPNGFTDYTNPAINAQAIWYDYNFFGTENTDLTDQAYAFMLKLKIVLNSNDGTLYSIDNLLQLFLAGVVGLTDNEDTTLTYTLSKRTPVSINVLKAYLPKPMGVGINFIVLDATYPTPITKTLTVSHGDHSLHTVVSDPHSFVVTNGTAPYNYSWLFVSGDPTVQPTGGTPTTPAWQFFMQGVATVTKTATYQGIVTDQHGVVAYTANVVVTLTIQEAP